MSRIQKFGFGVCIKRRLEMAARKRMYSSKNINRICTPTEASCIPPEPESEQKMFECIPDCEPKTGKVKKHPVLPKRGCLPWEPSYLQGRAQTPCKYDCEQYPGFEFIDRRKVSTCEFRRFQECYARTGDGKKCLNLAPKLGWTKKIYPLTHALTKKYLPGCPTADWQRIHENKETDCNFIFG